MTTLTGRLEEYIRIRRTLGFDLAFEERVMRKFTEYADERGAEYVTTSLFLQWKAVYGSANNNTWAKRLFMVRGFAAWLQGIDSRTEVPPAGLLVLRHSRTKPYIFTDDQISGIVGASLRLRSPLGIRGLTSSTLFGLIAVTGLRVSEALKLDDGDVDLHEGVITVHQGKNRNSRFVPVSPSTVDQLGRYATERERLLGLSPGPFFQREDGGRPGDCGTRYNFALVCQSIGLRAPRKRRRHGRGPRIHDLRHTFAVRTIIGWYKSGLSAEREMYKLSSVLGHRRPEYTYWYMEAVPELLRLASDRAARHGAWGQR